MKKPHIYMVVVLALVVFCALAAVYQSANPGRLIPAKAYTEKKATYLTSDYRDAAERLGIDKDKRGSTVYGVMAEVSLPALEEKYGITSAFYFTDVDGRRAHVYSNGAEGNAKEELTGVTDSAAELFDDGFARASNSDYGIPERGYAKLYVHRGDGVYFKLYKENEIPESLSELFKAASFSDNG